MKTVINFITNKIKTNLRKEKMSIFFVVCGALFVFLFFISVMNFTMDTILTYFYDISLFIYVPNSDDQAGINKMIIVFRQFILEKYSWVTLKLTNRQLSDVVLEMMGIFSVIMQNQDIHMAAFEYVQDSDLFIEKYTERYCVEFKEVRSTLSDRFTPETLAYAKYFVKQSIDYSLHFPDSNICEYVKLIKIKKWWIKWF